MNFLILGAFEDGQTGLYIADSIDQLKDGVRFIDIRLLLRLHKEKAQQIILDKINGFDYTPDVILVLKGLELTMDTLKKIREKFPKAKLVNWFFDVYLGDKKIWEHTEYAEFIKMFDYFFCSLKGVADKLNECGFDNAHYLDEACLVEAHEPQYMNNFQKKKYGEDISFCGSIGYIAHTNRIPILYKLLSEGFNVKIWGDIVTDAKSIPFDVRDALRGVPAVNEKHSMVCQSSLINLGIDQDPDLERSFSARLYRVMCAGGLYLTTYTKGLEDMFKINKKGEPITEDQELVVFYDKDEDLVPICDFLLKNDDIREVIAENGRVAVTNKHKFIDRIKEMKEVIEKNGNN